MFELSPRNKGGLSRQQERELSRQFHVARLANEIEAAQDQAAAARRLASVNHKAEQQAEVARALGYVTKVTMQQVTNVSLVEQSLGDLMPALRERLSYIGGQAMVSFGEVVGDTKRNVS